MQLSGYTIETRIYEGRKSLVYRGTRNRDARPVVIKVLRSDYPTPRDLARVRHEYRLNRLLVDAGVTGIIEALALESLENTLAIVFEDIGGVTLREQIGFRRLGTLELLDAFIQVARILGSIHAQGVLHKDIKPHNLIVSRDAKVVRITDLGVASQLDREQQEMIAPNRLEGTLAYMAPEQTGRMNRPVDARSDLYALGATMYEAFVRRRPFDASDPMELVHCHIARDPIPPRDCDPELPGLISDIILKLLSKAAQDRYQSAAGLAADLVRCAQQLRARGVIEPFVLGAQDVPSRFVVPERVYGREREAAELLRAFERIGGSRVEVISISGYSGIGKTALVSEVKRPISERRGYFLTGKLDASQRGQPYAPVQEAFGELVRQWLSESDEQVEQWRRRLHEVLGDGLSVMTELIPGLDALVGKQDASIELSSVEAQNRIHSLLVDFLTVAATAAHPLVIFFDDMQWADPPSLKIVEKIATDPNVENVLLLVSWRDNEVDAAHPLSVTLDDIHSNGGQVRQMHIGGLPAGVLCQLVADALYCTPRQALPLAELVGRKTAGNPFFFGEYLRALYREGLIRHNGESGWVWDVEAIAERDFADNVLAMMAERLESVGAEMRETIAWASVFGSRFMLDDLAQLRSEPLGVLALRLMQAVRENLLIPTSDDWKLAIDLDGDGSLDEDVRPGYRFVHDRVQQAAYAVLDDETRIRLHLEVGRRLASRVDGSAVGDVIFDIIGHFSVGLDRVTEPEERYRIGKLAFLAGKRAKRAAAWDPAIQYFRAGIDLSGAMMWKDSEGISLGLMMGLSECLYIVGRHDEAEELFEVTLAQATGALERAAVYNLRMVLYGNIVRYADAIECGRLALQACGIEFDTHVEQWHVLREVMRTRWLLRGKSVDSLEFLPELSDPRLLVAVRVLNAMAAPAYFLDANLYTLLVLRMLNLSLAHGNSSVSPYSYALYGMIAGSVLGNFETGMAFGELAVRLHRRYGNPDVVAKVHMITGNFVNPWRNPVRTNLEFLKLGYREGRAAGDLIYAGYCGVCIVYALFSAGEPLDSLYRESHRYLEFVRGTGDDDSAATFIVQQRMVLAAQGHTEGMGLFGDAAFDEAPFVDDLRARRMKIPFVLYCIAKMRLAALMEDHRELLRLADEALPFEAAVLGMPWAPDLDFYLAMGAAMAKGAKEPVSWTRSRQAARARRRLARWAENSPMNFRHKFELCRAELLRTQGKTAQATEAFENAIAAARRNGVLHDEAFAALRAARHHHALGQRRIERTFLHDARYAMLRWGAVAHVAALEAAHPELQMQSDPLMVGVSTVTMPGDTTTSGGGALDLTSVMKAAQAISSEIVLERLLRLLLAVLIENAGARRGLLLLDRDGELRIEADGSATVPREAYDVLQSRAMDPLSLPIAMVQYVARTREAVVVRDASDAGDLVANRFGQDPYLASARPRSILVAPIVHMQDAIGVLVLENSLNAGVFTRDRLELIQMLSSQIAISIQNAELYRRQAEMAKSLSRFVPVEFLEVLGKPSILEVRLGDAVEREMTVLFSDIRSFTEISEKLTPQENFRFLNSYLGRVGPVVRQHRGFVDKYIGDAVMALFPHVAEDALEAAVALQRHVASFNAERVHTQEPPLRIGVGLHFGNLMLGTIGEDERLEGTVISDAVNTASRLEGLTKTLGASILVSGPTMQRLRDRGRFAARFLGEVMLRGRSSRIDVFEIYESDPPDLFAHKQRTAATFEAGVRARIAGDLTAALASFQDVATQCADDLPAQRAAADVRAALASAAPTSILGERLGTATL